MDNCPHCGRPRDPNTPTPEAFLKTQVSDGKTPTFTEILAAAQVVGIRDPDMVDYIYKAHRRGLVSVGPEWEVKAIGDWANGSK